MSEPWKPSEIDKFQAHEAYFRYAVGLVMLNDPERLRDVHQQKDLTNREQQAVIVVHAKTLMWAGLSDVIRYANPPDLRNPFTKAENNFSQAFPHMRDLVKEAVEEEENRLSVLNDSLSFLQPLPAAHEAIYKSIAHGRKDKVHVFQTMDVYPISGIFTEDVGNETFKDVPRITIARRDNTRPPLRIAGSAGD